MNKLVSQYASPRITFDIHFYKGLHGRKQLRYGENQIKSTDEQEDLPRLTRLLALAHRWNRLIEEGIVDNYAEIAKMMGLSRARVTQIMDLLYLAPEIQEEILLSMDEDIPPMVPERAVREITGVSIWKEQCKAWKKTAGGTS